jgi:hypothetical protein
MKCPHCGIGFHPQFQDGQAQICTCNLVLYFQTCPSCTNSILELRVRDTSPPHPDLVSRFTVSSFHKATRQVPPDVPNPYRQDFIEADLVLPISPKASAALSRRIIQALLRDLAHTKAKDLRDQIDEVIASKRLPSYIAEDLHAVRNVGNFATHGQTRDLPSSGLFLLCVMGSSTTAER